MAVTSCCHPHCRCGQQLEQDVWATETFLCTGTQTWNTLRRFIPQSWNETKSNQPSKLQHLAELKVLKTAQHQLLSVETESQTLGHGESQVIARKACGFRCGWTGGSLEIHILRQIHWFHTGCKICEICEVVESVRGVH